MKLYKVTTIDYGESETPGKERVYLCRQTWPHNPKNFTTLDGNFVLIDDGDWLIVAGGGGMYKKGYFTFEDLGEL